RYGVDVVGKNELPFVHVFADYVVGLPAEKSFRGRGPARDTKIAVPLDDGERRTLDVKLQLFIRGVRCFFSVFASGDVGDDCDATGDFVVFTSQGKVMRFEDSGF